MNMRLVVHTAAFTGAAILACQLGAMTSPDNSNTRTKTVISGNDVGDPSSGGGEDSVGADVIVGDLTGPSSWNTGTGPTGGIVRYSWGTTSCNVGTVPLNWYDFGTANPTWHPVISQNLFRLKNGRFEHIGQAWLKHGFCALQGFVCGGCSAVCGGCCDQLGVGCSDPYTSGRNGNPGGVGPKSQINAASGTILVWPYSSPSSFSQSSNDNGQLHVLASDVDPSQNAGAIYFAEGMYVAQDDAGAGNDNNNASYKRVQFSSSTGFPASYAAGIQQQKPGIQAWKDTDPAVTLVNNDAADGRFILGYKVTDNGDGTWHYEYAVENLNSDRGGQTFSIPVPTCTVVTNMGFRDVPYHSGDGATIGTNYDGTDWAPTRASGAVTWTMAATAPSSNRNALRWATMYNFRFDADKPPQAVTATMNMFKTGSPASITFAAQGPQGNNAPACPSDANFSGSTNIDDLLLIINSWGTTGPTGDVHPPCGNGTVNIDDLLAVILGWGPCP